MLIRKRLLHWFVGLICLSVAMTANAVPIAVFDDAAFVDTGGGSADESDTIQASLAALGHTANAFTGTSAGAFAAGLAGNSVLLIPELENGLLGSALSGAAQGVITSFVSSGGGLIVAGGSNFLAHSSDDFLNVVFGLSVANSTFGVGGTSAINVGNTAGTAFAGGPASVPNNNATHPILAGLPGTALSMYDASGGGSSVFLMPFGGGKIVYLGWDWFNAAPIGTLDGGWLTILDNAVIEVSTPGAVPEPTSVALLGLGVGALAWMRRRRRQLHLN